MRLWTLVKSLLWTDSQRESLSTSSSSTDYPQPLTNTFIETNVHKESQIRQLTAMSITRLSISLISNIIYYSLVVFGIVAALIIIMHLFSNPQSQSQPDRVEAAKEESQSAKTGGPTAQSQDSEEDPQKAGALQSTSSSTVTAIPNASVAAAAVAVTKNQFKPKQALQTIIGEKVSNVAVGVAVAVKQSPIPDHIAAFTNMALQGYNRVENAFSIQEKLVSAGQGVVRGGVVAAGIFASAFIKAGVAYQMAPGYKEIVNTPNENDELVEEVEVKAGQTSDGTAASTPGQKRDLRAAQSLPNMKASPTRTAKPKDATTPTRGTVRILRMDRFPGTMPMPELTIGGDSSALTQNGANSPSQPRATLFGSVMSASTVVAAKILTSSSKYVFGEDATNKLLGIEDNPDKLPESEQKAIAQALEGPIRNLIVGGLFYATSLSTLRRIPGSKLARWFAVSHGKGNGGIAGSGDGKSSAVDKAAKVASALTTIGNNVITAQTIQEWKEAGVMTRDGSFFIDRDGTHFRHVLNHLRGLRLPDNLDFDVLKALRIEAVYYDLVTLVVEIDERVLELEEAEAFEREKGLEFESDRMRRERFDRRDDDDEDEEDDTELDIDDVDDNASTLSRRLRELDDEDDDSLFGDEGNDVANGKQSQEQEQLESEEEFDFQEELRDKFDVSARPLSIVSVASLMTGLSTAGGSSGSNAANANTGSSNNNNNMILSSATSTGNHPVTAPIGITSVLTPPTSPAQLRKSGSGFDSKEFEYPPPQLDMGGSGGGTTPRASESYMNGNNVNTTPPRTRPTSLTLGQRNSNTGSTAPGSPVSYTSPSRAATGNTSLKRTPSVVSLASTNVSSSAASWSSSVKRVLRGGSQQRISTRTGTDAPTQTDGTVRRRLRRHTTSLPSGSAGKILTHQQTTQQQQEQQVSSPSRKSILYAASSTTSASRTTTTTRYQGFGNDVIVPSREEIRAARRHLARVTGRVDLPPVLEAVFRAVGVGLVLGGYLVVLGTVVLVFW
ncbi:hypothetical protein HDU76_003038, partial [Blyttiomyces sp. JEL0837]